MNFWIRAGVFNPRKVRRSPAEKPNRLAAIPDPPLFDAPPRFKPNVTTPP